METIDQKLGTDGGMSVLDRLEECEIPTIVSRAYAPDVAGGSREPS